MTPSIPCDHSKEKSFGSRKDLILYGQYYRSSDRAVVQRFQCKNCRKTFSQASFKTDYRQKKRHLNKIIFELLVSGVSQRRAAFILKINRKTIVRKFLFLGYWAESFLPQLNQNFPKSHTVEFDDLITFEHTKCKPLAMTIMVEGKTRWIMGYRVSTMSCNGKLAAISRKKYGPRRDERRTGRDELFEELKNFISPDATIKSDQDPQYGVSVRKHFPRATHLTYKGRRGCIVGQGELKRGGFDPIFTLNHTYAMIRENINRLKRRTWATTKIKSLLSLHMALYALFHNLKLIPPKETAEIQLFA